LLTLCVHGVLWHWLCSGYAPDTQLYATRLWLTPHCYCMSVKCCLSVLHAFSTQMSKRWSLTIVKANLSFSFGLYFVYTSCCMPVWDYCIWQYLKSYTPCMY